MYQRLSLLIIDKFMQEITCDLWLEDIYIVEFSVI